MSDAARPSPAVDRAASRRAAAALIEVSPTRRLTIMAALGVGTFVTALSNSVLNAILPLIANAFSTDISAVEWIITTFLLVQSGLLLTFGRLGDMIGHRRVYLAGLLVFIVSMVLCALAPSVLTLIGARILQAAGAAMFIANSSPISMAVFPPSQRGRVLGIQATTVYLGLATGAPLGGILADQFGWQSVFLIPVPFAALALRRELAGAPRRGAAQQARAVRPRRGGRLPGGPGRACCWRSIAAGAGAGPPS